jgi:uncharacterized integral membrane protein
MRWVLYLPLVIVLGLFALSNMQEVELRLWPLDVALAAPLGIAMLCFGALAFLLGASLVWASDFQYRRRARHMTDSARVLEAELAGYKRREAEIREASGDLARLPAPGRA